MQAKKHSGFCQAVEIKAWTGRTVKVECDDNLNAISLYSAAADMLEALESIDRSLLPNEQAITVLEAIVKAKGGA